MDQPLTLLIVDDDEVDRISVRRALHAAGLTAEIDEEQDAARLVERAGARSYDCIILDYSLPGTNGLEVMQALRSAGVSAPVVMLTGQGNEDVAVALMKAGAADYIPKDWSRGQELAQRLRAAVRLHRAEERSREAHARLAAERELLKGVLEQMGAGVVIAGAPRGELILCNREVENILGQPYVAAEGSSRRYHAYDKQGVAYAPERWPLERSLAHGESVTGEELECERPDGERVFLHASSAPVHDSDGRVIAAVMTLHDVTEEHRVQEALREEARLIETLHRIGGSLASQLDPDKLVDTITREATQLTSADFGVFYYNAVTDSGESYVRNAAAGEHGHVPSMEVITPLLAQTFRADGVVRLHDITRDSRYAALARDVARVPVGLRSYMAVPVTSAAGKVIGGLFFGHRQPGAFSERDERIVAGIAGWAALAMDNARLYEEAQHAVQVRDEVLTVVSHDLRNPLNTIALAAESLLMDLRPDQRDRCVTTIRRSVERSNRLISDLLDASKIEAGKLVVEPTRLTVLRLLEQAIRDHEMVADKRSVVLSLRVDEDLPKILADRARVLQVLDNLIGNALRYTEAGGRVELLARRTERGVRISVSDTGAGIPPENLSQLFDRYWQAKQQHSGSAGLGLYIARGIVDAHGGTLTVESERGVGTTFALTLPAVD